ncbi:MAG TPA: DUF4252 domain-containing protein [Blastocatellia bacterium]|nr:DUF4252 domain-containing protein [Blastocatellia bacterium]
MNLHRKALRLALIGVLLLAQAAPSFGQDAKLKIESLAHLQEKASQTIDVTLDKGMLNLAAKFLSEKRSVNEAAVKDIVSGLKGVYVRSYEFDSPGEYSDQDVNSVLSQLKDPAWSRVVGVTCKRKGEKENIQVFIMTNNDQVAGLAAVAAGEKDLTVINIVGVIDVEKLSALCGSFGIPKFDLQIDK